MYSIKIKLAAILAALILIISATGCATGGQVSQAASSTSGAQSPVSVGSAQKDLTWDESTATKVTFSGGSIKVDGSGAAAGGSVLTISKGGTYLLSGTLTDGQVVVSAPKTDTVKLVLGGVNITSNTNAAIYGKQVGELIIILADGSQNTVTDAQSYIYADTAAEEPDAAIFCKNDMTIGGTGSLTVNANFYNGIGSKDDLVILGGVYDITAANHGIRGRDSLTVLDGSFTINAGNDGIQSNNDADASKGWISLEGGSYNITAAHDGIQAETALSISGGEYTILSGGGSANVASASSSESYKGLKAGGDLTVSGGVFHLDCADDTIHSNANIAIKGGTFTMASGDDGVHADADLSITGGTLDITRSYEGLEGNTITIADGVISVVASDDGINAAGGSDGGQGGRFGQDKFTSSGSSWLHITGGKITVNAQGDGIDSNGDITMSGGTVFVSGPTSSGDGALDYDGTFNITGGILVAAGSSGMAEAPSVSSSQASLRLYYTSTQKAGTTITLSAADGTILVSFAPQKDYQSVVISTPDMKQGSTYTVSSDGSKVVDVILSSSVTSISDTGAAVSGNMRGGSGGGVPGGMQDKERRPMTVPAV